MSAAPDPADPDLSGGGIGRWLFQNRGWLPVPLLAAMLSVPVPSALSLPPVGGLPAGTLLGAALILAGESVRLWAVGHIGRRSRTRGGDVGGLMDSGPYARVRNPLYIGNILLFAGFGAIRWPWIFVVVPMFCFHYHHIIAWEERNLSAQLGQPYRDYLRRVPRWFPRRQEGAAAGRDGAATDTGWSGREALRSERGTFAMLALILAALWLAGRA